MDIYDDYKWEIENAQDDINRIWRRVKKRVVALIKKRLQNEKDIPFLDEIEDFSPDWHYPHDWNIITKTKVVYNCMGSYTDSESRHYMEGRLYIMRLSSMKLTPSLKFVLDGEKQKFFVDVAAIRVVMQDQKKMEENSAWVQLGPELFKEFASGDEDPLLSPDTE